MRHFASGFTTQNGRIERFYSKKQRRILSEERATRLAILNQSHSSALPTSALPTEDSVLTAFRIAVERCENAGKLFWLLTFFKESFREYDQAALIAQFGTLLSNEVTSGQYDEYACLTRFPS